MRLVDLHNERLTSFRNFCRENKGHGLFLRIEEISGVKACNVCLYSEGKRKPNNEMMDRLHDAIGKIKKSRK